MGIDGSPRSILVRGPNWLGDLVMSTPGLRALRAGFPKARITLQVRPGLEPIVAGAPWVDEIVPVRSYHRGPIAWLREARLLRSDRFDLGVCLPESFSSALLMRLGGVRHVVGYGRGARDRCLHQVVPPDPGWGRRRLVARERFVLGLCRALGCPDLGTHTELFTTPDEEQRARTLLDAHGIDDARPIVALAPGASYGPAKCWPAERFAAVGDSLAGRGAEVVVLGTAGERGLAASVVRAMKARAADLAGAHDLGVLKALLRRSALLVANDAGARHVAVAFGVPCVVLFGPTSVAKTDCNLERVRVVSADTACSPCYQRRCPIDHRCMTRIEASDVAAIAGGILEPTGGAPA